MSNASASERDQGMSLISHGSPLCSGCERATHQQAAQKAARERRQQQRRRCQAQARAGAAQWLT
jgi:hypothetical protein